MPDPRPPAPAEASGGKQPDDHTGDFTPEELAAAGRVYEGTTFTLEEVLEHARLAAARGGSEG